MVTDDPWHDPWKVDLVPRTRWHHVVRWMSEADTEQEARTIALWFAVGTMTKGTAQTLMGTGDQ
jgi:hypothetical protein